MSITHWVIVAVVVFLLFGAGKLPRLMGDFAEGIKAFKKGMKEDEPSKLENKSEKQE
jgi:sec-independent protein translocase protein TatA